ncbi:MAG: hypothetical protein WBP11_02850 [Dokdonella sp.]
MTARNSPADKPPARKSAAGKTPSTRKNSKAAKAVAVVEAGETISNLVLDFVGNVPGTFEPASGQPRARAGAIVDAAARKSALAAGSLSLPVGPLGWLTLIPELTLIWRIQAQMVTDIAAAFGRRMPVSREQMLYCLFRHTAAQAFRDIGVRMGERGVVQALTSHALRKLAGQVGIRLSKRTVVKGVARWVPLLGAAGVAAYAWYDSRRVGATAIAMFDPVIDVQGVDLPVNGKSINVPARRHVAGE